MEVRLYYKTGQRVWHFFKEKRIRLITRTANQPHSHRVHRGHVREGFLIWSLPRTLPEVIHIQDAVWRATTYGSVEVSI